MVLGSGWCLSKHGGIDGIPLGLAPGVVDYLSWCCGPLL
jgi:hypothetical protein